MNFPKLAFICAPLVGVVISLSMVNVQGGERRIGRPRFDKWIGKPEADIVPLFGKAVVQSITTAERMGDELRKPIRKKFAPNRLNTKIKELVYDIKDGQQFFWLARKNDHWVVVGDAYVPKGVSF